MLDIKKIRDDPEPFRIALARRGMPERVDELLAADARRRELTTQVETLRAEQNLASKAIGKAEGDEKQTLIAQVASVSAGLKETEPELADADAMLTSLLAATPNIAHESAPDGLTEEDAVEVRRNHRRAAGLRLRDPRPRRAGERPRGARRRTRGRGPAARGSST